MRSDVEEDPGHALQGPFSTREGEAIIMVGASRFERPTSRTPSECATGLRHAPTMIQPMAGKKVAGLAGPHKDSSLDRISWQSR